MQKLLLASILTITLIHSQICAPNPLYSSKIDEYLAPFNLGISHQMIKKISSYNGVCRVEYKDHKLIHNNCLLQPQICFYESLAQDIPDVVFVLNRLDQPRILKHKCNNKDEWPQCACDKDYTIPAHGFFRNELAHFDIHQHLPIFSPCTITNCFLDIVIPTFYHTTARPKRKPFDWSQKQFGAIWRGSPTGGRYTNSAHHFTSFHRQKLYALCDQLKYCDFKWTQYGDCPVVCQQMREYYGPAVNSIPIRKQALNKILIDIDGNTYSGRFVFLLFQGSAVFKIKAFQDLATMLTQPWRHYVPVKMDLSDFRQKMQWARDNDKQLKKIAQNGRKHALKNMGLKTYQCYMKELLTKYHSLIK